MIPSTVVFVACDAHPNLSQLSLSDPDSCPIFDRWRHLRTLGIAVDFQRIRKFASSLPHFKDFVLDLSEFEERSVIGRNDRVSSQIYQRRIDGAMTVVKAISVSGLIERCQIETKIENLLNLRHPMITPLIGCVFPVESSGQREFRTVRLYATEGSLADAMSNPPTWWTPTVKAKAVVGIALALRFAPGLGLLHRAVKASNILFDANRWIQIADFSPIRLETGAVEPFSGEEWAPTADVCAFASLLFEIAVGAPTPAHATHPIGGAGCCSSVCFANDRGLAIARICAPSIIRRNRRTAEGEPLRNHDGR
jgi:serine/threonine protein kinase